jgi:hypothetical protein
MRSGLMVMTPHPFSSLPDLSGSGARFFATHCCLHPQVPHLSQIAVSLVRVPDETGLVGRKTSIELFMRVEGAILLPNEIEDEPVVRNLAHAISPVLTLKALCSLSAGCPRA